MKLVTTLSAATLAVALGLSGAYAQSPDQGPGGASASPPSMAPTQGVGGSDTAPKGPSAGAMREGQAGPDLTGPKGNQPPVSAESESKADKAKGDRETGGKAATKGNDEAKGDRKAETKDGDKGDRETRGKAATKGNDEAKGDRKAETKDGDKGDRETRGKDETKAEGEGDVSGKTESTAEGRKAGKDGKSVKLESQQVSKVKTYFSQHKPRVKTIDRNEVSVSIGIALPSAIVLYDLPPDVIVVGGPCPVKYFVWGDDIVLVDACSREVVEIIVGVA